MTDIDFVPSDQDDELRQKLRSWITRNTFDPETAREKLEHQASFLARQLGQEGFMAYVVPHLYGGVRETVQAQDLCIIRAELAYFAALADVMFGFRHSPVNRSLSRARKNKKRNTCRRWLAPKRSEPCFDRIGSRLDAGIAQTYVVFASTDPGAKAKGISAFIVDADSAGFSVKEKTRLLSPHPIGVLGFDECFVPQDRLLGIKGIGLNIALQALDILRCTVGAGAVGLARRPLREAITYSRSRHQFGHAIAEFQGIQFKLAEMATDLAASRLLVYQAAAANDRKEPGLAMKSSIAKLFATEAAHRIVDQALQIHGGSGVVAGDIMERLYRDVRALRIHEGTSEIQKLLIARELLK